MTPTTRTALLALWRRWPECAPRINPVEASAFSADTLAMIEGRNILATMSAQVVEDLACAAIERAIVGAGCGLQLTISSGGWSAEWLDRWGWNAVSLAPDASRLDCLISAATAVLDSQDAEAGR